jgi:hypothetical protein
MGWLETLTGRFNLAGAPTGRRENGTLGFDGRPIGAYSGNHPAPMDMCATRIKEVLRSMVGPPALEYAGTHDPTGTYFGLNQIPPIEFPFGPPHANQDQEFEAGSWQEITWEP